MKNALVIAAYFGKRRRPPEGAADNFEMIKFYASTAMVVDPGCECDVIISCNQADDRDVDDGQWYGRCEQFVNQLDGLPTARGHFRVIQQKNIGLSLGAYSAAFMRFRDEYQYFCFTEDDHVFVREGFLAQAISQIEDDSQIGVVSMPKISNPPRRNYPPFARGGISTISTAVLNRVVAANISPQFPSGCLPHAHHNSDHLRDLHPEHHQYLGHAQEEVEFTNCICREGGLKIVELEMDNVLIPWCRRKRSGIQILKG